MVLVKNFGLFIFLLFTLSSTADNLHKAGHLQPLGSQLLPVGDILTLNEVPSPQEFYDKFVQPSKPVLFKGAATNTPSYELWTDDYLSAKFGKLLFDVEEGKKENRSKELFNMTLDEFLSTYQERDVYLVASLPQIMRDDIYLLKCLLCGGFTDELQDSVMWFSNGGTKSVLHYDAIDNINCLMSGTKDLYMVDKRKRAHIDIDRPDGSFCAVDVDKVDLEKYPGLADVPWYKVHMEPGDCLFIPYRWFHQVRSYGPRNLAINIWFGHRMSFNSTDCEHNKYRDEKFAPLSAFHVTQNVGPNLAVLIIDEMEEKSIDERKWLEIVKRLLPNDMLISPDGMLLLQTMFQEMDSNKDSRLSPEEVMNSSMEEYQKRLMEMISSEDDQGDEVEDSNDVEDDSEIVENRIHEDF